MIFYDKIMIFSSVKIILIIKNLRTIKNKKMLKKTDLLFHFTPSIENLKGIFEQGFKPHFCEKFVQYRKKRGKKDDDYFSWDVYPIVSFCNIG